MLQDVLASVCGAAIYEVIVLSSDEKVRRVARRRRCRALMDSGSDLNSSLMAVLGNVLKRDRQAVIIPADLPLLHEHDIEVVADGGLGLQPVLSPSRDGGTNALSIPPSMRGLRLSYGIDSFRKHLGAMLRKGFKPLTYWSLSVALDIDTRIDLIDFWRLRSLTRTQAFLESIEFGLRTGA